MKIEIENPYGTLTGGSWLRGNLHTHTTRSDGTREPQEVLNAYAAEKYDFLMLSDHDIYTAGKELAKLDHQGMVLIPGNEVSANGPHLLHVNGIDRVFPNPCRQSVLNEIQEEKSGFAIACHPNWQSQFDHTTISQLREWVGYLGIEIYNGVIGRLDGSPYATNKWDMLLSSGRRLWGFANDDSHRDTDVALGWNMVYSKSRTIEGIMEAFAEGRFYASTGVVIREITVDGSTIRVVTENAERIVALGAVGKRLAQADANTLEFHVSTPAKYVRFECWGRGEQFAWTQPFMIREVQ